MKQFEVNKNMDSVKSDLQPPSEDEFVAETLQKHLKWLEIHKLVEKNENLSGRKKFTLPDKLSKFSGPGGKYILKRQ